jgi:hypothetical protein
MEEFNERRVQQEESKKTEKNKEKLNATLLKRVAEEAAKANLQIEIKDNKKL